VNSNDELKNFKEIIELLIDLEETLSDPFHFEYVRSIKKQVKFLKKLIQKHEGSNSRTGI